VYSPDFNAVAIKLSNETMVVAARHCVELFQQKSEISQENQKFDFLSAFWESGQAQRLGGETGSLTSPPRERSRRPPDQPQRFP
jgi:hypothetical protein